MPWYWLIISETPRSIAFRLAPSPMKPELRERGHHGVRVVDGEAEKQVLQALLGRPGQRADHPEVDERDGRLGAAGCPGWTKMLPGCGSAWKKPTSKN